MLSDFSVIFLRIISAILSKSFKTGHEKSTTQQMTNNCCMMPVFLMYFDPLLLSAENMYQADLMWFQCHIHIQRMISTFYFCLTLRKCRETDSLQIFYILSGQSEVILEFSPFIQYTSILLIQCTFLQIILPALFQIFKMKIQMYRPFILEHHRITFPKIYILFLKKIAPFEPRIIKT